MEQLGALRIACIWSAGVRALRHFVCLLWIFVVLGAVAETVDINQNLIPTFLVFMNINADTTLDKVLQDFKDSQSLGY